MLGDLLWCRGRDNPQGFNVQLHSTEVESCPVCGSKMEGIQMKCQFLQCSNSECGYKQRNLRIDATGAFAIGAIVGLGMVALIYLLTKK